MTTNPLGASRRVLQPHPDLSLTLIETGQGRPALVLHGGAGPDSVEDVVARLARGCRVLAPTHPGWDDTPGRSGSTAWTTSPSPIWTCLRTAT
jgi:pimeloyl-ACP methyl ester carboxylesterase